jgi:hypothetical protein
MRLTAEQTNGVSPSIARGFVFPPPGIHGPGPPASREDRVYSLEAIDAMNRAWSRANRAFCDLIHRGRLPDVIPAAPEPLNVRPSTTHEPRPPPTEDDEPLVDIAFLVTYPERRRGTWPDDAPGNPSETLSPRCPRRTTRDR